MSSSWTFIYGPTPDGRFGTIGEILQMASGEFFPAAVDVIAIPPDIAKSLVVRLRLVVEDGQPVCSAMTFERAVPPDGPQGPEVTPAAIEKVAVGRLLDEATVWLAKNAKALVSVLRAGEDVYSIDPKTGRPSFWTEVHEREAERSALRFRRQRKVDDRFLREVAECYLAAERAPTDAVAAQFHTAKRNATRWVSMARDRDILPPYQRSKES